MKTDIRNNFRNKIDLNLRNQKIEKIEKQQKEKNKKIKNKDMIECIK